MYTSACLSSSPTSSTLEVVPSPVTSSWAVAARAISEAVGCWICISPSSTVPSLVSLMSPEPDTSLRDVSGAGRRQLPHIFIVPLGPRFVLSTSCSPRAAPKFSASAAEWRATSALGFSVVMADMALRHRSGIGHMATRAMARQAQLKEIIVRGLRVRGLGGALARMAARCAGGNSLPAPCAQRLLQCTRARE